MSKCKGKVRALLITVALSAMVHSCHESGSLAWRQDVQDEMPAGSNPDVHTIVDRALARSAAAREREIEGVFCRTVTQRTQTFDDDGRVIEERAWTYAIEPFRSVPFYRLVARNGAPLDGAARDLQEVRWREFVNDLENRSSPAESDEDGGTLDRERPHMMVFNPQFPARYALTLLGLRVAGARPAYVVGFRPKGGRLPVRRRMDHALNKSHGEIWIDRDTSEVARVTFRLMERVRWWWGILGSISDATGHIDRRPVDGGVWIPSEVDVYFHTRVLFSTTRRRETSVWSDESVAGSSHDRAACARWRDRGRRMRSSIRDADAPVSPAGAARR